MGLMGWFVLDGHNMCMHLPCVKYWELYQFLSWIFKLGGIAKLITFLRFLSSSSSSSSSYSSSFFLTICYSFYIHDRILTKLGQEHVWGDSYKSLTRIGGPGSPGTSGVKNVKQCAMTTKLGQKNHWCKLKMMMTFTEVKGQQRSNVVNNMLWLPNLVRRILDAS